MPDSMPRPDDTKHWLLMLALRVAAVIGAVGVFKSDLPYLLGFSSRRRSRSAEKPAKPDDSDGAV